MKWKLTSSLLHDYHFSFQVSLFPPLVGPTSESARSHADIEMLPQDLRLGNLLSQQAVSTDDGQFSNYILRIRILNDLQVDVGTSNLPLIHAFISLQLFGLIGITIMLVTALFFSGVSRNSTWFSFMFSWIIYTLSYTLLFISGQLSSPKPPYGLCFIQSIMVCSAPPLCVINLTLKRNILTWF